MSKRQVTEAVEDESISNPPDVILPITADKTDGYNKKGKKVKAENVEDQQQQDSSTMAMNSTKRGTKTAKPEETVGNTSSTSSDSGDRDAMRNRNPVVLKVIATYLPTRDLSTLRQTSNLWNGFFTPELKNGHETIEMEHDGDKQIKDFIELMKFSKAIPFSKFDVSYLTSASDPDFQAFASICGPSVTKLELIFGLDSKPVNMDKLRQLIFERTQNLEELTLIIREVEPEPVSNDKKLKGRRPLMKELPNLRTLVFRKDINSEYGVDQLPSGLWNLVEDILANAVRLESFTFDADHENEKVISIVRDSVQHLNQLNKLNAYRLKTSELQLLIELAHRKKNGLQLDQFATSLDCTAEQETLDQLVGSLYTFLVTQSSTLQTLKINLQEDAFRRVPPDSKTPIRLPRMPHVQHFQYRYETFLPFVDDLTFEPLGFDGGRTVVDNFPSLKRYKCSFDDDDDDLEAALGVGDQNVAGVTDLKLTNCFFWSLTLGNFPRRFPAVNRLELVITEKILSDPLDSVWTSWPTLRALHISYKPATVPRTGAEVNLDELLTGIPSSSFEALQTELANGDGATKMNLERVGTLLTKYKIRAGLNDLKFLECFVWEFCTDLSRWSITDIGGYFGLAVVPTLQHLQIMNNPYDKKKNNFISTEGLKVIREAVGPYAILDL